jgi:hypothetical protein
MAPISDVGIDCSIDSDMQRVSSANSVFVCQPCAFNMRLRPLAGLPGVGRSQLMGCATALPRSSADAGKDLREIQELLRHKKLPTSVRYTHIGYEQQGKLRRF